MELTKVTDPVTPDGHARKRPSTSDIPHFPEATGYALISELAGGKPFGDYCSAFPAAASDAGKVLRISVQVGLLDCFLEHLERALREKHPVPEAEWLALLAKVPWPRPLPEWDRGPIGEMKLLFNPAATPDWPEPEGVRGCHFGFQHPGDDWPVKDLPSWLRSKLEGADEPFPWRRSVLKVGAITFCVSIIGLALPSPETLDFWVAMAALVVALIAAAL